VAEDPKISDLRAKLDAWSKGALLGQNEAREVRNALFEMLKDAIDLPELRLRNGDLRAAWLNIPKARGNPQSAPMLHVCDDPADEYGSIRAGMIAAVRFVSLNAKKWNYAEADDDYVASAPLIDHLVAQLKPKIIEDAKAHVSTLGRALITQSRIAGLSPPLKPSGVDGVLSSLFAAPDSKAPPAFDEDWDKLYSTALGPIGSTSARELLQTELFARSGCFQGDSGRTPFALDIARLLDTIGEDAARSDSSEGFSEELKAYLRLVSDARIRPQLNSLVGKLSAFRMQIAEFIDEDFDKAAFVADLQSIVFLLAKTGTTPAVGPNLREFERQLVEFKQSAFVDLVNKATTAIEARDEPAKLLNALGSIDLSMIARTMDFLRQATNLVMAAETSVAREESDRGQSDPAALSGELIDMLSLVAGAPTHSQGVVA
jgi:hypothetical protein